MGAMTSRRLVAYEIMMEQTPTSKYELKDADFTDTNGNTVFAYLPSVLI